MNTVKFKYPTTSNLRCIHVSRDELTKIDCIKIHIGGNVFYNIRRVYIEYLLNKYEHKDINVTEELFPFLPLSILYKMDVYIEFFYNKVLTYNFFTISTFESEMKDLETYDSKIIQYKHDANGIWDYSLINNDILFAHGVCGLSVIT